MRIPKTILAPFILLAFVALPCVAPAQIQFTITGVDPASYPDVHVSFTAFDNAAKRILSFQPSDFTVVENGVPRTVKSVTCPQPVTPLQSVTITMDISYSMSLSNRLTNAKNSAEAFVRALQVPPGRIGITTFDNNSYVTLNYSTDTAQIQSTLAGITASGGGTDFYGAFMDPVTGAIDFTKNAAGFRYILFITDANQNLAPASETAIINAAKAANIKIFTLTMSQNTLNYSLRRIASQTGGQWYENVTSEAQIDLILSIIRDLIVVYPPCDLVYTTTGCDQGRDLTVTLRKYAATNTKSTSFVVPAALISTLDVDQALVDFGTVPPGTPAYRNVTMTARNGDITVQSISPTLSVFDVVDYGGTPPPFLLTSGQSRTIRLRFSPTDAGRVTSEMRIATTASCTHVPMLAGGLYDPHPMRIVQPNGGEKLYTGSTYFVKWICPQSWHPIMLDYSTNAGASWMSITQYAYALSHNWFVPETPSTTCLALAYSRTERMAAADASLVPQQSSAILNLALTPDGSMMALALADGRIRIIAPQTGAVIANLSGHTGGAHGLAFSPDGTLLATGGYDGLVRVWATATGALTRTLTASAQRVHSCEFSRDGLNLVISDENAVDMYRVSDWSRLWRQAGYSSQDAAMVLSPAQTWIASGAGQRIALLRYSDGGFIQYLNGHTAPVRALAVSDDGGHLASGGDDQSIIVWDAANWSQDKVLKGHSGAITALTLSQYALQVISASRDRTLRVWDVRAGTSLYTLAGHTDEINGASYSPGGGIIASGGKDKSVRIWGFRAPFADISDSLWSIISTLSSLVARTSPFDTLICAGAESVRTFSITNVGNQTIAITAFDIQPPDAFSLVSVPAFPDSLTPGDSLVLQIRFTTPVPGTHQATLHFTTSSSAFPSLDIPIEGFKQTAGIAALGDSIVAPELYHCTIPITRQAMVMNTGTVNLSLDSVTVSDAALLAVQRSGTAVLAPGQVDTLRVTITPSTPGVFNGTIDVHATPCNLAARIIVTGPYVDPAPRLSATALDFGATSVGDSSFRQLWLRNPTRSVMVIDSFQIAPSSFSVLYPVSFPLVLAALDSVLIELAFHPAAEGAATGSLWFDSVSPCMDTAGVALAGSSSRKPEINTLLAPFPVLLCPDEMYCDTTLSISNGGGEPLVITDMRFTGGDSTRFALVPPLPVLPLTIQPGTTEYLHVRFTPAATGAASTSLTIGSNAFTTPRITIAMQARKDSAGFALSTGSVSKRFFHCDLPLAHDVTVINTGTVDRIISIDVSKLAPGMRPIGGTSLSLGPGERRVVTFVLDSATATVNSTAVFSGSPCPDTAMLAIADTFERSTPDIAGAPVDFGAIGAGTTATRTVTLTAPAASTLRLASATIIDTAHGLSIVTPAAFPALIAPGAPLAITLQYAPPTGDTLKTGMLLVFDQPCNDTILVAVQGSANSATAAVSLPDITARVGDVIRIPVRLDASSNLALTGTRSFTCDLVTDRSVLWPMKLYAASDSAGFTTVATGNVLRVVMDVRQAQSPVNGVIAELECLVLLGDTDRVTLGLENFGWRLGRAATTSAGGTLTIKGICDQGGMRFMSSAEQLPQIRVTPNPFNPRAVISFTLTEDDDVTLTVYDALGREVSTLVRTRLDAGMHSAVFEAEATSSGVFYAVLRTNHGNIIARMVLEK